MAGRIEEKVVTGIAVLALLLLGARAMQLLLTGAVLAARKPVKAADGELSGKSGTGAEPNV